MKIFGLFYQKAHKNTNGSCAAVFARGKILLIALIATLCVFVCNIPFAAPSVNHNDAAAISLLARSAATMLIHNVIQTNVRVEVQAAGETETLVAQGKYIEQKNNDTSSTMVGQPMFRLDLKFPPVSTAIVGAEANEMTIVCNARSVSHYTAIEGEKRLERIVVKDLDQAIRESKTISLPYSISGIGGLGGLAGMVKKLPAYYDFPEPPQAFVLEGKEPLAIWKLSGKLKAEWQKNLQQAQNQPQQIPTEIEIFLGRDDLFPYRIHYSSLSGAKSPSVPVAKIVFSDILFGGEVAPLFRFETFERDLPQGVVLEDVTENYLRSLGI